MIARYPTDRYDIVRVIRHLSNDDCGVYIVKKEGDRKWYVKKTAFGEAEVDCICREYRALKVLDHPNIIKMVECFADRYRLKGAIVVEYHKGGDLLGFINDHKRARRTVGTERVKKIFKDLAAALAYCHFGIRTPNSPLPNWDPIIHKDIKLENIFLRPDDNAPGGLVAILGDFGWATNERAERELQQRPRGTFRSPGDPNWVPPEVPHITEKSDVWGLAAVIACVCQRVTLPLALRRTGENDDDLHSPYVIDAQYDRRVGEILDEMSRVDVERRWDSRRVFQEVDVGLVYWDAQGGG